MITKDNLQRSIDALEKIVQAGKLALDNLAIVADRPDPNRLALANAAVASIREACSSLDSQGVPVPWVGIAPHWCDACGEPITDVFYDVRLRGGPWGQLCPFCAPVGPASRLAASKRYQKRADGRWYRLS